MQLQLQRPLAIFDLETTGIDIVNDRIVEIGIVIVNTDGSEEVKNMRINPGMPIPIESSLIHGIYDEDVAMCPTFADVAEELYELLDPCDLGGFNSNRFDVPILLEEFLRCEQNFRIDNRRLLDMHTVFTYMEKRDLTTAYKFYCDKDLVNAHSAEADARATYEVFLGQMKKYAELEGNLDKVQEISNQQDFIDTGRRLVMQDGSPTFNFGKHKGKTVEQVLEREPGYYSWIMNNQFPLHTKKKLTEIKNALKRENKLGKN